MSKMSLGAIKVLENLFYSVLILHLLAGCFLKKQNSDLAITAEVVPTTTPGAIAIIKNPDDGTVTVPADAVISSCLQDGNNTTQCMLPKNLYSYSVEYGGKIPEQNNAILFENAKSTTGTLPKGWYSGNTKAEFTDSSLLAANIRQGVNLFGITGTVSTSRPAACTLGAPMDSTTCSLSAGLYVYSDAYGGRSIVCNSSNSSSVSNCWLQQNSKFYLSSTQETLAVSCTNSDNNKAVPISGADCWAAVGLRYYDQAYGGRTTLCATDESVNPTACWADNITTSVKSIVSSSNFNNWCQWDAKTTSDCRVRINVATSGQSTTPESKAYGYIYTEQYGGRTDFCTKDGNGYCWLAVEKSQLDTNLKPDVIKAGISIFGIVGKFRGEGSWKSGAHRDSITYPLAISDESFLYGGAGDKDSGLPDGYREVPLVEYDDEGTYSSAIVGVDRTGWGDITCGTGGSISVTTGSLAPEPPPGFTSWSIRARLADCGDKFGLSAVWDGTNKGNAGQSKWKMVVRTGNVANGKGREVWLDENTGLLWSSLVETSINWCKASGSNNISANSAQEDDPQNICDNSANQATSGDAFSACFEGTGFTTTGVSSAVDSGAGKAGLSQNSALPVGWRLPTLYDYEVGEYNGIRFVMPDMGVAMNSVGSFYEWTATINNSNKLQAWVIPSKIGGQSLIDRSMTARARCIGRANILQ